MAKQITQVNNDEVHMKKLLLGLAAAFRLPRRDARTGEDQSHRSATDVQHVSGDVHPSYPNWMHTRRKLWPKTLWTNRCEISTLARPTSVSVWFTAESWMRQAADSVAEHDQVSEVYHVISGISDPDARPGHCQQTTPPGDAAYRCGVQRTGKQRIGYSQRCGAPVEGGDVVVIPAGTGHWFTKIDDHINYLMIRIDPDKVTPLKSEAQSKEYLSKPAPR